MRTHMHENTMLYWLANAARGYRLEADPPVKQVRIAAAADTDQSTVFRFEQSGVWPRDLDVMLAAYAEALDLGDPRAIWDRALASWRTSDLPVPTVEELRSPRHRVDAAVAAQPPRSKRPARESASEASPRRRQPRRAG